MNRLKELLEKYWQCETSIEEERELRTLFSGEKIPQDLTGYKTWFAIQKEQAGLSSDKTYTIPTQKRGKRTIEYSYFLRIASVVLILLTFGIGIHTHRTQNQKIDEILSETYTNPEDAAKDTREVVAKVSSLLLKIEQEKKMMEDPLDSLHLE